MLLRVEIDWPYRDLQIGSMDCGHYATAFLKEKVIKKLNVILFGYM
jgi:hypothetical protein